MSPLLPVISSLSVLLTTVEDGVVTQPSSVWLVSLGGCGLARAQSAMMFTRSCGFPLLHIISGVS